MIRRAFWVGLLTIGLLLAAGTVARSRKALPPPCDGGRFLLPAAEPPLVPGGAGASRDVVILADDRSTIAIASGCTAAPAKTKATKKGTSVKGGWSSCGASSRVRLSGRIGLDCNTLTATFRAKKTKPRKVTAVRSECGDGVLDAEAGETCEPGLEACPGGAACTSCACGGTTTSAPASTSSTSTVTTSTAPPASTVTTTSTTLGGTTSSTAGTTTTSTSSTSTSTVPGTPPPDPSTIAPPLPAGIVPSFAESVGFLYEGGIIQTGVAPGTIEDARVSVARGRVLDTAGDPLAGVRVTVLDHPELGQTITRMDGRYDLAVNGGGTLVLRFTSPDYVEVQRPLTAGWNEWEMIPDVVMTGRDALVTMVTSGGGAMQMAQGSPVTDADGTRRATVLFPPGTTAQKVLANGSTVPLPTFHVRASEYTVGDAGPAAMPGTLPATSAYTYAVELSVDEAEDAVGVEFSQHVTVLVDNFLGFPAGVSVPLGVYNRRTGQWEAEKDGRVIDVLGSTGGLADLDIDGDHVADDATALATIGVTADERTALAGLYPTGGSVWRVRTTHFSPKDCNWPWGFPPDACLPQVQPCPPDPLRRRRPDEFGMQKPCDQQGSIISCESQSLREIVPVRGTPYALAYSSNRAPANAHDDTFTIVLSGNEIPPSLDRIEVELTVEGRHFMQAFGPATNLTYTFNWDGLDVYGRPKIGPVIVHGQVRWHYPITLNGLSLSSGGEAESFGTSGGGGGGKDIALGGARQKVFVARTFRTILGQGDLDARTIGIGGWTLDAHHVFDPQSGVVFLGDGGILSYGAKGMTPVAGNGTTSGLDAGQATATGVEPYGVAVAPDGTVWIADKDNKIRRVDRFGVITTATCTAGCQLPADGLLLSEVKFNPITANGLIAVDRDGRLLVVEKGSFDVGDPPFNGDKLWRVETDGTLHRLAGNGMPMVAPGSNGGVLARDVPLTFGDVTAAPDGSVYVTSWYRSSGGNVSIERVYRIPGDGKLIPVAGSGLPCLSFAWNGEGQNAAAADLCGGFGAATHLHAVADEDGTVFVTSPLHGMVIKVNPEGVLERVAGVGAGCGDFVPGSAPLLSCFDDNGSYRMVGPIRIGEDGAPLVSAALKVDGSVKGLVLRLGDTTTVVAGGGTELKPGGSPTRFDLRQNYWPIDVDPNGILYIADSYPQIFNRRVWKLASPTPLLGGNTLLPAPSGAEAWVFDPAGRHLETRELLTGAVRLSFGYDGAGRLASLTDDAGNVTTVEHDGNGAPTAIIAPGGQRTDLAVDAHGWLTSIEDPLDHAVTLTYAGTDQGFPADSGLLRTFTPPGVASSVFGYDPMGLLTSDQNALGGVTTLARTELTNGLEVVHTTPTGAETTHRIVQNDDGMLQRTVIAPDGGMSVAKVAADGSIEVIYPDGGVSKLGLGSDPRFGASLRFVNSATLVKGARTLVMTSTRTLTTGAGFLGVGTLTETANIAGATHTWVLDAVNRRKTRTTPTGRQLVTQLDTSGRPASQTLGAPFAPIQRTWNAKGFLATLTQGVQSRTYVYDAHNHLMQMIDAGNRSMQYTVDDADRPMTVTYPSTATVASTWTPSGDLDAFTLPGGATHDITTNGLGLRTSYLPPGNPAGYLRQYRSDGSLEKTVLPSGREITLGLDAGGRVDASAWPEASTAISYTGNLELPATMTRTPAGAGNAHTLTYGYDTGLLTSVVASGAATGTYSYDWSSQLLPTTSTFTSGLDTVTYGFTRNADRQVTGFGPLTFTRNATSGAVASIGDGNTTVALATTPEGRLASRSISVGGTPRWSLAMTWDASGLPATLSETTSGTTSWVYDHDGNGRLTDVTRNATLVEHYDYDLRNNRTGAAYDGGAATVATYDLQDRIQTRGATSYTVDVDGFVTARGPATFVYSATGELLSATASGTTVTYDYDALRRRVRRTQGGAVTEYFYGDLSDPLRITAYRGPSGLLTSVLYDHFGLIVAFERGGQRWFVGTDAVGSIRAIVDDTGAIVRKIEYDAFGRVKSDSNVGFDLPFGFAGGLFDPVTDLVRFGLRDYEPASGRWLARDPSFLGGEQFNLYAYVPSPVGQRDPSGLFCLGGSSYVGVGGGGRMCVDGNGFSACVELGVGIGEGTDVQPFAGTDPFFNGFEAEAKVGVGPLGIGGGAGWGNYGDPRLGVNGWCLKGSASLKASLLVTEVDLLDPSSSKTDPTKFDEAGETLDDLFKDQKAKIGAEAKLAYKNCQKREWGGLF